MYFSGGVEAVNTVFRRDITFTYGVSPIHRADFYKNGHPNIDENIPIIDTIS
jgi:hypothetical protein